MKNIKQKRNKFCSFTTIELLVVIAIVFIFLGGLNFPFLSFLQIHFWILFGWIGGLFRYLRGLAIEPGAMLFGLFAFLMFFYFLHRSIRVFQPDWPVRRSANLAGLTLAGSIAAIALVSAVHNIYWLKSSDVYFEQPKIIYRMKTTNNIKQIFIGACNYQNHYHYFPVGGAVRKEGIPDHSWITRLLPYLNQSDLYEKIHKNQSWRAPENKNFFSKEIKEITSTEQYSDLSKLTDAEGYALSGIAANECILPTGGVLNLEKIPDGAGNTILLGEVSEKLRPWGDPVNARDPRLGLNTSPYGFGSFQKSELICFGFCDGSVRALNKKIDPAVLKALSMPDDGKKIDPTHSL